MLYSIAGIAYRLAKSAGQLVLKKDVQFDLFGGTTEVPLTPKAKKRSKVSPGQMSLLEMPESIAPAAAPKPRKTVGVRAPSKRQGERKTVDGITYELNANSRWEKVEGDRAAVVQAESGAIGGLQMLSEDPTPAPAPEADRSETPTIAETASETLPIASGVTTAALELKPGTPDHVQRVLAEIETLPQFDRFLRSSFSYLDGSVYSAVTGKDVGGGKLDDRAKSIEAHRAQKTIDQFIALHDKFVASGKLGSADSHDFRDIYRLQNNIGKLRSGGALAYAKDRYPERKRFPAFDNIDKLSLPDPKLSASDKLDRQMASIPEKILGQVKAQIASGNDDDTGILSRFRDWATNKGMNPDAIFDRLRTEIAPQQPEPIAPQSQNESQAETTPASEPPLGKNADYESVRDAKTRAKINRQVRELLAAKPEGPYSEQERSLLASYSGWGGIRGGDDASINEYYTRSDVAKFCVDLLHRHGFKGGTLLEPSCGSGVFLSHADRPDVLPIGVEMDETSSAVARALNPHAEVMNAPFERFCLDHPNLRVDGVVGNVPFGTRTISRDLEASQYKLGKWKDAADFFIDESLEQLSAEGHMALILPHGVVSGASHMNLRQELVKKGRVLGVYRLPESAFAHTGTNVVADILIVQKHPNDVLNAIASGDTSAIAATNDPDFVGGGYFNEHPDHVLGEMGTKKRGFREAVSVTGDINESVLNAAPQFTPAVNYEGLSVAPSDRTPQPGDVKYVNGKQYVLNKNHRWERVGDASLSDRVAVVEQQDSSAYGTETIAEAEAILQDPGRRVMVSPDQIAAYTNLAKGTIDRSHVKFMEDASAALGLAGSSIDREKIAHAVLLAGHIKSVQSSGNPDPTDLSRTLQMLQSYREQHGNPATDRKLKEIAPQFNQIYALQGAFDETGKISDYFADPEKVQATIDRDNQDTPAAAMAEAFRANGGEAVTIADIRSTYGGDLSDDDLSAMLLADPGVGYANGTYQPIDRLLRGNGFDLIDSFLVEADRLPPDSPRCRKLEDQAGIVRSRLQPRAIEDMTTPFWAVGAWIPVEAFNAFMSDRGYDTVKATPKGYRWAGTKDGDWHGGLEDDVLLWMNRERISHGANTREAKEAVQLFETEFRDWLAGSDYRMDVEAAYNNVFNGDLTQDYSGEPLDIEGIDQHDGDPDNGIRKKRLHHYQTSTIRQMAEQGRGIISLGVGLGKTAASIALSQHLRQTGRSQKPGFVVPKSVLANWVREIGFWGKDLNVMILGQTQQFWQNGEAAWEVPGYKFSTKGGNPVRDADGNYTLFRGGDKSDPVQMSEADVQKRGNLAFSDDDAATKQRKLQQLSQNSYDLVLMSEPVFQDIPLDPDREYEYLDEIAGKHLNPEAKATKEKSYKLQEQIETRKRKLAERRGDKSDPSLLTWEDLGIDCLIHDEAHHLKNLFSTGSRTGDVAFLSAAESNRSLDFYYKSRYTREQNNNQNVYLLTATPTTNNPLEAFNMLQHVCPEEFERRGIQNVDDFLQMFGKIEEITVPGTDLEMTRKNGLTGFKNLKDLRKLFTKYCRMQSAKDVNLPIPEERSHDVIVNMTPAQTTVYGSLKQRAKALMKEGGGKTDDGDHVFSVISDMDKAAIDLDYYNKAKSEYGEWADLDSGESAHSPKIASATDRVIASRAANGGKQIVFCDAIQLHDELKRRLVAAGYPENEIMIVNAGTAKKSSDRQKISQAYNDGRITLVIGNTATMGEGMNFQIGTTDIHHLTTPWTPAAIEQRNGRGVRQGNDLDEVNIHYYHANKSFDLYRKGVLERKRGWIDELWKGTEDEATNQNTGAMSMEEIAVMMSDDPEAARQSIEANKEAQMQRFRDKQTKDSLRQFGSLQTMKLAIEKMDDKSRSGIRGKELVDRYERTKAALSRNEYFPYKSLLDGSQPAYIGTDGTVLTIGNHVETSDGSIARITAIDMTKSKIVLQPVLGREYSPMDFNPNRSGEINFKQVNGKSYGSVKPIQFDDAERDRRVLESVRNYEHLRYLSPDAIDENREMLIGKIREGKLGGYDYVPHVNPNTGEVDVKYGKEIPPDAQILFPHDGDAIDRTLQSWGQKIADGRANKDDYYYRQGLAALTGKDLSRGSSDRAEVDQKLQQYCDEYRANKRSIESEPKSEAQSLMLSRDDREQLKAAISSLGFGPASSGLMAGLFIRLADKAGGVNEESIADMAEAMEELTGASLEERAGMVRSVLESVKGETTAIAAPSPQPELVSISPELADSKSTPTSVPELQPVHPDPIGAIHQAILNIEENDAPDRGSERNNAGWSGATRRFGSSIAAQIQAGKELSPNQIRSALTMLQSAHRRQAGDLPTHDDLTRVIGAAPATSGNKAKGEITHIGDAIGVKFPYDKATVARIKDVTNSEARWNKVKTQWEVPFHQLENLKQAFPDFETDDRLHREERVFAEPPKTENKGLIRVDGNQVRVSFPYNKDMVSRVKGVKVAGRQAGKWNGREWEFPNNDLVFDRLSQEFPEFDLSKAARLRPAYTLLGVPYSLDRLPNGRFALIQDKTHAVR